MCVESALLFDCQARMWWKKDLKRLKNWMEKIMLEVSVE